MKKLLVLGGSFFQIAPIKKARELGHYVIVCDYLENNSGQHYSHEYHNISTTDKEAVLSLAKRLNIDGILCYASDSAAPTAAYVAEKLQLPICIPYKSVEILTNKDLYKIFLKNNNFHAPKSKGYNSYDLAKADISQYQLPIIIKPVDSSGSRGVSKINSVEQLLEKVQYALQYSQVGRFVLEEFIEKKDYMITGDGFMVNGKIVFHAFANTHFKIEGKNSFIPVGMSWPANISKSMQVKIRNELQRALNLLEIHTSVFSFDIMIDLQGNIHLIEIGPRNSGYLVPSVIKYATGIDLDEFIIKAALGEDCSNLLMTESEGYFSCYMIHSEESGIFNGLQLDEELKEKNLIECIMLKEPGDYINEFIGANFGIGILILRFSSMEEMLDKMDNMNQFLKVKINK